VRSLLRALLAGSLGAAAALIVACGGSGGKLIPVANAGPLQNDFEAIVQDAQTGDGDCSDTEAAILRTEQDFAALPGTVDAGLRGTLRQGIENLRSRALAMCAQPLAQTDTTTTTPKTTTTQTTTTPATTTPTSTSTTPTTTTPTTTTTTPGAGGGTAAPEPGETPATGGGTGVGENSGGASPGGGASPEGGK
jgi:hypothetical protein